MVDTMQGGQEMTKTQMENRISQLETFVESLCWCPCCEGLEQCAEDCTFHDDAPEQANFMNDCRMVLYEKGID